MNFDLLVRHVLNENNTAIPIIGHGETIVFYATWADGNNLSTTMGRYSDKHPKDSQLFQCLLTDVSDLSVEDCHRAWDIFASEIYQAEGELTNTTKALNSFNKKLTKLLEPYLLIHGQWFAGESVGGPIVIGVKVDLDHPDYRSSGLRDIGSDIANQTDIQDISDW